MRFISVVILFVLVCSVSSGITFLAMRQDELPKQAAAEPLAAPPGFVATRTSGGAGIYYQRQDIAELPAQAGQAAFPKAMNISAQAKCRLSLAQDRSTHDPARVKITDEYCNHLLEQKQAQVAGSQSE
jgi:hypothetical protein